MLPKGGDSRAFLKKNRVREGWPVAAYQEAGIAVMVKTYKRTWSCTLYLCLGDTGKLPNFSVSYFSFLQN